MVPGLIPGGVTGDFFRGSPRQNHVPWGRLSLWKWVPGISPEVKAAGAYGWRPTTLVVPNITKIRGLNLPGTPWATPACCRMTFTFYQQISELVDCSSNKLIKKNYGDYRQSFSSVIYIFIYMCWLNSLVTSPKDSTSIRRQWQEVKISKKRTKEESCIKMSLIISPIKPK